MEINMKMLNRDYRIVAVEAERMGDVWVAYIPNADAILIRDNVLDPEQLNDLVGLVATYMGLSDSERKIANEATADCEAVQGLNRVLDRVLEIRKGLNRA